MERFKVIVVDDEYLARELMSTYIQKIPDLDLIASVENPMEVQNIINHHQVDLMFLDIEMPQIKGMDLIKQLEQPPAIVLTTAYSNYALEAFEWDVLDYLVKPFPFDRFLKSVQKFKSRKAESKSEAIETANYYSFRSNGQWNRVKHQDILFFEADREYVKLYTTHQYFMFLMTLKQLESDLPAEFIRVHKSYIVSKNKVESISGFLIQINGYHVPVSRTKKSEIVKMLF